MKLFLTMVVPPETESSKDLDETLFFKIAENDMEAFETFYRQTERTLYAFILSIIKNHDEALDLLQDTYLKVRASAHLYKPMGKPMAWVFTIARNLTISRIRKQTKTDNGQVTEIENDLNFSYISDPEDRLVLTTALEILNEEEREVILLHAISGFTHRELAENLDLPISTVLSKYHRGLKKLKKHLLEKGVKR
jgi:RNA polymerase sigma-70 factor (ECF subfamily)